MDLATQEPIVVETPEAPSIDEALATNWATIKEGQPRDETGKFKPAVIGENTLKEEVSRESTELPTEKPAVTEVTPEKQAEDKAPSSWRKEAAAKWAALDPELKAEIQKRETDFHKGYEGYKPKVAFADEIQRVTAPYEANFKALGIDTAYAVKTLLDTENILRNGTPEQKASTVSRLIKDYGIDLQQISTNQDPYVAELQQKVSNYEAALQHQKYQQDLANQGQLTSTIEDFAKDHEHFESVRVVMGSLLSTGQAKDMQDAYDKAVWANPDIRASLLAKQQEEQRAKAKQIAEEAKRKAATNVTHRGNVPAAKPTGTLDDAIRENAQALGLIS